MVANCCYTNKIVFHYITELKEISEIRDKMLKLFAKKSFDEMMTYYTDDVHMLAPGTSAIVGKKGKFTTYFSK